MRLEEPKPAEGEPGIILILRCHSLYLLGGAGSSSLLKKPFFAGCSKMPRCKAPKILRSEAYFGVRRNDEGWTGTP